MLELLSERAATHPEVSLEMDFALVHEGLGDHDKALEYLQRGLEEHLGTMVFIGSSPAWRELRDDPRFQSLLEEIGLTGDKPIRDEAGSVEA